MAKSKNRKGQKLKSKNRTNKIMDQQRKQERDMAKMLDQMQKQKVGKDSESETLTKPEEEHNLSPIVK